MRKKVNKKKIWLFALLVTATVFLIVAGVKVFIANDYLMAAISMITTIVFSLTAYRISKDKIRFDESNDGMTLFFPIGFVFTIVGASGYLNAGVWGFGITLFIVGMFFSSKKEEKHLEEKNAG